MHDNETPHYSHPMIVKRLKRAQGHIKGIIEMIEADRPCLDIVQQLQAVEKAVQQAKKTLIHDHLDHCLDGAVGALDGRQRQAIDEFRDITKYL